MKMKKFLCVLMTAMLALSCCIGAYASDGGSAASASGDKTLKFNEDGSFKILMFNDTQDLGKNGSSKMTDFLIKAIDSEDPDLVVFVGDQLSDVYPFASAKDFAVAVENICKPLEDRGIPFLATLGNHDHDRANVLDEAGQYALYDRFTMNYATENGPDPFTYNVEIKTHDGSRTALNIFMMDSNNKAPEGGYAGIGADQLAWYNETSAALKEANGGTVMPSMIFQHVPVKEIYNLFKECSWNTDGAVYSRRDGKWYVLDENKIADDGGRLGEAPCSENFDRITGQYQAWLENGDIIGAFFGHDHVNSYWGVTDDGIKMGYNGGCGFRSYGDGGCRSVRVFEFSEDDVTNYTTRLIFHDDLMDEKAGLVLADVFSPALLTKLMKVVYFFFGWAIGLFK
ncbi:MAG: metallophosphoesterase family protein [Clostridia bacterium]|nr:metallophosphoesterase family protein [Clostridia bacterium]